jgi:hypothetical protein
MRLRGGGPEKPGGTWVGPPGGLHTRRGKGLPCERRSRGDDATLNKVNGGRSKGAGEDSVLGGEARDVENEGAGRTELPESNQRKPLASPPSPSSGRARLGRTSGASKPFRSYHFERERR